MSKQTARTRLGVLWTALIGTATGTSACTYDFDRFASQEHQAEGSSANTAGATGSVAGTAAQLGGATGTTTRTGGASNIGGTTGNGTGGTTSNGTGGAGGSNVGSGGTSGPTLDEGLVAHYAFDETSGEVAANRIDATKNGKYVGACTHPTGRVGGAVGIRNISSTVSSEWIELPVGLLGGLSTLTLSIWVRDLSTTRSGGRLFHFSKGASDEIYFSPDQLNPSTSRNGGHLGGARSGAAFVDLWSASPTLTDKVWHQVALTWSAASIELYIDGNSVGRKASPGVRPSDLGATSPNWLGRTLDDGFIALYAEIDDLRIYNRAMTASEIAQRYRLP